MAEFTEVIKNWRRMCDYIQRENRGKEGYSWCFSCPVNGCCYMDSELKDAADIEIKQVEYVIQNWAAEHPEPIYPTWGEWLLRTGQVPVTSDGRNNWEVVYMSHIPAEIAEKLGIEPKEEE